MFTLGGVDEAVAAAPEQGYYERWLATLERSSPRAGWPTRDARALPPRVGARRGADAPRHADRVRRIGLDTEDFR